MIHWRSRSPFWLKGSETANELDKLKELKKKNSKYKRKTKALKKKVTNDNDEGDDNDKLEDSGDHCGGNQYKKKSNKNWLPGLPYYVPWIFISYTMKLILKWLNILYVSSGKAIKLSVQKVHTGQSRIISAAKNSPMSEKVVYGIIELDYHADTTVTGANWFILKYTGKQC